MLGVYHEGFFVRRGIGSGRVFMGLLFAARLVEGVCGLKTTALGRRLFQGGLAEGCRVFSAALGRVAGQARIS